MLTNKRMLHITHAPHGDGIVAIETLSVIELELKALGLVSVSGLHTNKQFHNFTRRSSVLANKQGYR